MEKPERCTTTVKWQSNGPPVAALEPARTRIREVKVWRGAQRRRKRIRRDDLEFMFRRQGGQRTGQFESVVAYPALFPS